MKQDFTSLTATAGLCAGLPAGLVSSCGAAIHPPLRQFSNPAGVLPRLRLRAELIFLVLAAAFTVRAAELQTLHGHMQPRLASWTPASPLPATNRLNLAISLPLRNPAILSNLLQRIYDPASPAYHHYLSPTQFTERFGPTEQEYQAVMAFAQVNHLEITATHPNRLLLDVRGSAEQVEKAFHLTLLMYQHPTENRTFYAPDREPSLDLTVPILHISGLDNYGLPRPHLRAARMTPGQIALPKAGSGPSGTYMGLDFRAAYLPDSKLNGAGQAEGLLEFDGYTPSDIAYYENAAGLADVPLENMLIDGATGEPSGTGGEVEVSLDIEMAISMATNLSEVIVYEAPNGSPFEDLLNRMANDNLAKQISCSWYIPGGAADPAADLIFQQMAAQGQSFFSASGDEDAYTGLIPFPGDTPYITEVGGTMLTTTGPGGAWASETVWNDGEGDGSGGGISTQYPIPSWQTNISMTANQGSPTMRNVPDVALTAESVYVRADGSDFQVWGTSCAAPLWAGFAALVNQQAAGTGQPAIGFINPALDTIGSSANYTQAFHDITTGNNTSDSSPHRFYATTGYDLCTGWGTPAGQNLIDALANPEPLLITPSTTFSAVGGAGGPFFPAATQVYSLTNSGTNSLTWTISNTSLWLSVSSSSGSLEAGGPASYVTVSLDESASNLVVGAYIATLLITNQNDNIGQSRQFSLSVIAPPSITQQPANQAILDGTSAVFGVQARGGLPLAYQWQCNGTNLTDGAGISGSTTTNLTITDVSTSNVGAYTVVVTNFAGIATSSNAILSITPSAPVITSPPQSQIVVAGTEARFSVAAVGSKPFFYQWLFNSNHIDGATNALLTLANVPLTDSGSYAVEITNELGSTLSSNAILTVVNVPVIISFSPGAAAVSNLVTISGANFGSNAAANVVYFGAVQAPVLAARPTNLVVSVPPGATFAPITVTVNGLTAFAPAPFLPTFPGGASLSAASLGTAVVLAAGNGPGCLVAGDLDGDGKPDLVVLNGSGGNLYVYRNLSTNGTLATASFAAPLVLPIAGGPISAVGLALADLTGDGRLDIVYSDFALNEISLRQNFSSPGSLTTNSFGPEVVIPVSGEPGAVAVADLNGDGQPDIVTANESASTVSILQNVASGGILTTNSFAAPVSFATGSSPCGLEVADLDGDGWPDVVTINQNSPSQKVSLLRNEGLAGVITTNSLVPVVNLAGADTGATMAVGDLDGDGKPDLVVGSYVGQSIAVYRNTSVPGSLTTNSFAAPVRFALGARVHTVALGDLNGDGKLDVAAATELPSELVLFENLSTPGSFTNSSLGPQLNFGAEDNAMAVIVADLDGDGRPDLAFVNQYSYSLELYQNLTPFATAPVIVTQPTNQTMPAGSTASFSVVASGAIPLSYQWFFNETTTLAGATNAVLTLADVQFINAGSYSVVVTNLLGSVTSSNALLTVGVPPVMVMQPTNQTVSAGGTAGFSISATGQLPLSYQWFFEQTNLLAGATNPALTLTNVQIANSGSYAVIVSNSFGLVSSSNALLTVLAPPGILMQPLNRTATVGGTASFSVNAVGTAPLSYQWFFDQTNLLAGDTNALLTLANVQPTNGGNYSVLISNLYGFVISGNALLTVNTSSTNVPVIISFSPGAAAVSNLVTISGANFGSNAAANVVYFGAVQAPVLAARPTNLVVSVPPGATFAPITVTVNGLTAFAPAPFLPTFPGGASLSAASLGTAVVLAAGNGPGCLVAGDLDGDGKPDLVVLNGSGGNLYVYRNLSTNGTLATASFAAPLVLPIAGGPISAVGLALADLTGDGRLDIVYSDFALNEISLRQNFSSPGSLTTNSFGPEVVIPVSGEPGAVAVADLNGDGQPDIVTANESASTVSILQNVASGGILTTNSFAAPVSFATGSSPCGLEVADLDGDGWPDVVTINQNSPSQKVSLLRNEGLAGVITTNSLVPVVNLAGADTGATMAVGDLDGDGKPDLVVGSYVGQSIAVYRNTSVPGSLTTNSFAAPVRFALGARVHTVALGDLNGDGKLDVAAATELPSELVLFENLSTPGSFTNSSLGPQLNFGAEDNAMAVIVADLDGDGRPDLAFVNQYSYSLELYQNLTPFATAPVIVTQPTNQTMPAGSTASFSVTAVGMLPLGYQWYFNGTRLLDNAQIEGSQSAVLAMSKVTLANSGNYQVVCTNTFGSATSVAALLDVGDPPQIVTGPVSRSAPLGCTISFSAVVSGSQPLAEQWWKDGNPLNGQTEAILTVSNFQSSDLGNYSVVVTNWFGSVTSAPAVLSVGSHPPVAGVVVEQRFAVGGLRINMADLLASDVDTNGDTLTIVAVSPNSTVGGSVAMTNNWIYYAPPAGWTNSDLFTYTVSDGFCGTAEGSVIVQVKPNNSQPVQFGIGAPPGGPIQLSFSGIPGNEYELQYTDDLLHPNWQQLAAQVADGYGVCQFTDGSPTNPAVRYYRASPVLVIPTVPK